MGSGGENVGRGVLAVVVGGVLVVVVLVVTNTLPLVTMYEGRVSEKNIYETVNVGTKLFNFSFHSH